MLTSLTCCVTVYGNCRNDKMLVSNMLGISKVIVGPSDDPMPKDKRLTSVFHLIALCFELCCVVAEKIEFVSDEVEKIGESR